MNILDCWCKSNKLAIDCCLKSKKTPNFSHKKIKQINETCLHFDCSLSAIQSHNIPCAQLKILSSDSFFLVYKCDKEFLDGKDKYPSFQKKGINDVGIFRGFCKAHDNEIFRPIDSSSFEVNQENIFLTGYRAACYQFSRVQAANKTHLHYKEKIADFYKNINHEKLSVLIDRGNVSASRDLPYLKEKYSKCFINKSYENLEYCIFYLKFRPWFLLNSVDAFIFDLELNVFPNINLNSPIEEICISVQMHEENAILVFSHLNINKSNFFRELFKKLDTYSYNDLQKKLMLYVFFHGHGMVINPSALTEDQMQMLSFFFKLNMDNFNPKNVDIKINPFAPLEFSRIKYKLREESEREIQFDKQDVEH